MGKDEPPKSASISDSRFGPWSYSILATRSSELLQEGASFWGGGTQVLLAYLVQAKARDWLDGKPLRDLAKQGMLGSRMGNLSVHHLLPRELAESREASAAEVNCVANYAIIS